MAVSGYQRRHQLASARQDVRDAISRLDSAVRAFSEVAADDDERDVCDSLEMASSELTDIFDLMSDLDADDEEE